MVDSALCRRCGIVAGQGSSFCHSCGYDLSTPPPRVCLACARSSRADELYCGSCGTATHSILAERFHVEAAPPSGPAGLALVAVDTRLDRRVFIKILPPTVVSDMGSFERIRHSAAVMTGQHQMNCVAIYALTSEIQPAALIMEWISGPSFSTVIRRQMLDTGAALATLDGVLAGLSFAHGQGLAHGYLTASRILIDAEGQSKITDFGLRCGPELGDFAIAPEVRAHGNPAVSPAADIYSVGSVLRAGLRLTTVPDGSRRLPDPIRDHTLELVELSTAADPARRISTIAEFRERLAAIADEGLGSNWRTAGAATAAAASAAAGAAWLTEAAMSVTAPATVGAVSASVSSGTSGLTAAGAATPGVATTPTGGVFAAMAAKPVVAAIAVAGVAVGGGVVVASQVVQGRDQPVPATMASAAPRQVPMTPAEACPGGAGSCFEVGQADVDGDGFRDAVALSAGTGCGPDCEGDWQIQVATATGSSLSAEYVVERSNTYTSAANPWDTRLPEFHISDINGDGRQDIMVQYLIGTHTMWYRAFGWDGDRLRSIPPVADTTGVCENDGEGCGWAGDVDNRYRCEADGIITELSADYQSGDSYASGPSNGLMKAQSYQWNMDNWSWSVLGEESLEPESGLASTYFDCPGWANGPDA